MADLRVHGPDDPSGVTRGPAFTFRFDGTEVAAHPGESIAGALLAAGVRQLRTTRRDGRPRGLFCAIGTCFDCLVEVDGARPVRACLTEAGPGSDVRPTGDDRPTVDGDTDGQMGGEAADDR
jgi:predicted molibdopterin-dependent oxidoreductase YjgC